MTKSQRRDPIDEPAKDEKPTIGKPECPAGVQTGPQLDGQTEKIQQGEVDKAPDPHAAAEQSEAAPDTARAAAEPATSEDEANDVAPAPRLDGLSRRAGTGDGDGEAPRTVDFTVRDDDADDAAFGPKLAAWLEAYRARQAANAQTETPPRTVQMLPTPPELPAADDAGTDVPPVAAGAMSRPPYSGAAAPAWAGRARVAFEDMIAADGCSPPPEWIAAAQAREMPRNTGSRWLMVAALGFLMAGTATVAFVAAARNAGVDPTLGTVVDAFSTPSASPRADSAGVTAPSAPPAPARPRVEIVDTRVIPATLEAAEAVAPPPPDAPASRAIEPPRRSVLLLPTQPKPGEIDAQDRPRLASQARPPARIAAVEAAIEAASEPAKAAPEPLAVPGQEASPALPAEVRIASLSPVLEMIGSPSIATQKDGGSDGAPSLDLVNRRAHALLQTGDVMAARMLYEMAARGGDAEAALGAGLTYDPSHFERLGVRGIEPDAEVAIAWYRKALGNGEKAALDEIERLQAWLRR